jgi:glycosyltransferase involved in cell wall biosynthesis
MTVRALGPRRWTHGSVGQDGQAGERHPTGRGPYDYEILPVAFWAGGGSRYLVPSLPFHLWTFRPRYLYLMEEMDRPSFFWHALLARILLPGVKVVGYSLQNIERPAYHRWHHRVALRLNRMLADRFIAASREAADVLSAHGFRGRIGIVPLWGSESHFTPGGPEEMARAAVRRNALGIPADAVVLLFAGSLVEAKGLRLLKAALPRYPRLRVLAAGLGPLASEMRDALGSQWIHLGALQGRKLAEFYRLGDYVILPSLSTPSWKEQIGRSLIEGILAGAIALGSDSGHIPELTVSPEAGFRQGDVASLSDLLGRLPLKNAGSIREAQRRKVEEMYTASATARRTWEFLERDGS